LDSRKKNKCVDKEDICDIMVSESIELTDHGNYIKCLCPFHDDINPSMAVYPQKNRWWCFVCQEGGDSIDFIMRYKKMNFVRACDYLGIYKTSAYKKNNKKNALDLAVCRNEKDRNVINKLLKDEFEQIIADGDNYRVNVKFTSDNKIMVFRVMSRSQTE